MKVTFDSVHFYEVKLKVRSNRGEAGRDKYSSPSSRSPGVQENIYIYIHMYTYIYIYIRICMCMCVEFRGVC